MGEWEIFVTNTSSNGKQVMIKIDPDNLTVEELYK